MRSALHRGGLRFRKNVRSLPGSPDVVFVKARVAIFVDGCFWHGCPIHGTWPKTNEAWWREKIGTNQQRDVRVNKELVQGGWRVVRVWQHEIEGCLDAVASCIELVVRAAAGTTTAGKMRSTPAG